MTCVFIDNEKHKQLKLKCTKHIQAFVHLAGDIRIVRACIKCWTPQLFPQIRIWVRDWGKKKQFLWVFSTAITITKNENLCLKQTWRKCAAHLPTPAGQHRRWQSRYRCSPEPPTCSKTATWRWTQKSKNNLTRHSEKHNSLCKKKIASHMGPGLNPFMTWFAGHKSS